MTGVGPARVAYAGLGVGLVLFTALILYQGIGDVAAALATAGRGLLVITLFHLTTVLAHAVAWRQLLVPPAEAMGTLFRARWIAESVNDLLPAFQVGGNVLRAQMLSRASGLPGTAAGASVVVDITLNLLAQVLFTAVGVGLLLLYVGHDTLLVPVLVGMTAMAAMLAGFHAVQRRGLFALLARFAERVMQTSDAWSPSESAGALDAAIHRLYRGRRSLAASSAYHLLAWFLGAIEVWLALRFLGHPVGLTTAILLESLVEAVRTAAFAIPGGLGVQEGGYLVLGSVLGLPPEASLALSLVKRVRELLLGVPGLLAWQAPVITAMLAPPAREGQGEMYGAEESTLTQRAVQQIVRRGSRLLERPGRRFVHLDEDALLALAAHRAGVGDFGDEGFREPMRRLLHSLEGEARLNFFGRVAARENLAGMLTNLLEMQRDRVQNPAIATEEIRRPLFITGLPRTGSTLLHGLLAEDPANRVPRNWELMFPSPPPERSTFDSDRRADVAERQIRWFHHLAPDFSRIHPVGARLPEECVIILSHSFLSHQFSTAFFVPTYHAWTEKQDLRPSYRQHRRFLQQLQWRCPGERWVLKAPPHLAGLPSLFAEYPDAGVIVTHRDPLEVLGSVASLHYELRRVFSDATDPLRLGPEVSAMLANDIRRGIEARDGGCATPRRFFDLRYADLLRDPLATVRRIYTHFDIPLGSQAEARMHRFLVENPQHKHGTHEYSLADFGLSAGEERERYRAYRERFGV